MAANSSGSCDSKLNFEKCSDRLKQLYPAVNEEETPLPRSWSPKDKYNYIGLSQNNLRVHYKGKKTIGLSKRKERRIHFCVSYSLKNLAVWNIFLHSFALLTLSSTKFASFGSIFRFISVNYCVLFSTSLGQLTRYVECVLLTGPVESIVSQTSFVIISVVFTSFHLL